MKPPAFDYYAARNLEESLTLLRELGSDARLLAGGQSLVPLMNMRLARPRYVIDINGLTELDYIRTHDGHFCLGALTRHRTIERSQAAAAVCPLLSKAVRFLGHPQVRSRGTIGGSVAHADPAAEYPTVIAALDGEIVLQSLRGKRVVGWRDFFVGHYAVDLEPDEMVVEVRFPQSQRSSACEFLELSRRHGDFALVEVAVHIEFDESNKCAGAAIGLGGVDGTPLRASDAEAVLQGRLPNRKLIQQAASVAMQDLDPVDDIHASASYRKKMVSLLVVRALEHAAGLAPASGY